MSEEIAELQEENKRLRDEVAYLRRVHADTVLLLTSACNSLRATTR